MRGATLAPIAPVEDRNSRLRLYRFSALAFLIEAIVLISVGSSQHWLAHPPKGETLDPSRFIEAEMVQIPKEKPVLTAEKPLAKPAPAEKVFSKVPDQGKPAKPTDKNPVDDSNVTSHSPTQLGPTHGPVAVFSPPPVIPPYLRSEEIHSSAVIDFFITAQGGVIPKLVGSSGNQELDAIAIRTAQTWQFRPAERNHEPVDSKVRLRILFEVH